MAGRAGRWASRVRRGSTEAGSAATKSEAPSRNAAETRASAADAMAAVAQGQRTAGEEIRRDARFLKAAARRLRFEAGSAWERIAKLQYGTARNGLKGLIKCLQKKRNNTRDQLVASFNRLGQVLAKFFTPDWNWRIVACGLAALVAAVHGFVLRVDDPILNVALSGVHKDVWTLVYVGLGAMVFLASALEESEYSKDDWEEKLQYWNSKARRSEAESKQPVSLLGGLKRRSYGAVGFYALLLLVPIATSCNVLLPEPAVDALRSPAPPYDPHVLGGATTLNHAILLLLVVAFIFPAVWVAGHLMKRRQDAS